MSELSATDLDALHDHHRTRLNNAAATCPICPDVRRAVTRILADRTATLARELAETRERLARVAAVHYPSTDHRDGYKPYCVGCWEAGGYDGAPLWPCTTTQALNAPADAPQGGLEPTDAGHAGGSDE